MRQSCTSRCRGLTPLRGSSGKRERWASRSGERGCRGRGCLRGRGTLRGISSGLPSPPAPLGCFLGRGRGPVRALRSSPRAWTCGKAEGGGEDTHTHTPPAPRIAGSPAASGPTWPGSGGARHPPAGRPDKAEGALPSRNGRGGGGGLPAAPAGCRRPGGVAAGRLCPRGIGLSPGGGSGPGGPAGTSRRGPPRPPRRPSFPSCPLLSHPPSAARCPFAPHRNPAAAPPASARAGCPHRGRGRGRGGLAAGGPGWKRAGRAAATGEHAHGAFWTMLLCSSHKRPGINTAEVLVSKQREKGRHQYFPSALTSRKVREPRAKGEPNRPKMV